MSHIKVAVDGIVFGYSPKDGVSVLLIERKYPPFQNKWAIPGGFVLKEESLEDAVKREIKEETGVNISYLEQLYTFGDVRRDPRQRVISVAYLALVKTSSYQELKASTDAENAAWFNINELPVLAFDHKEILNVAVDRIRAKVRYQPIGFELLDKKFTFAALEKLYSALLGKEIDRRNFQKKILSFDILEELDEFAPSAGAGRPAKLFRFNSKKYKELQKAGFSFEL